MPLRVEIETDDINMTPMIDVVFNLLIFFLLSSTYLREEHKVNLELPKVAQAAPLTDVPEEITVNVLADGEVMIDGEEYSLDALLVHLRQVCQNYPDQQVAVRGDASVRYEKVAQVIARCKQAGVTRLDVMVQEE